MFIKELEIRNILGCQHTKLCFSNQRSAVYVLQSDAKSPVYRAFCAAVQLICSGRYASIESLLQFENLQQGSVRIVLLVQKRQTDSAATPQRSPAVEADVAHSDVDEDDDSDVPCTSQQARERELRRQRCRQRTVRKREGMHTKRWFKVTACRDFSCNAEQITYSIDDGPTYNCSMAAFHGKFCTTIDYILPRISQTRQQLNDNWLQSIATDMNGRDYIGHIFERFIKVLLHCHDKERNLLPQLTTICLMGHKALDEVLAVDALKILKDARAIFEYITYMEYTVWFLIPHLGGSVDVADVAVEMLDIQNMRTCIKLKTNRAKDCREYEWMEVGHAIQDLLIVAFQLAIAFNFKYGIVYLQEELNALKNYQTMHLVTAAYLQRKEGIETAWSHKNYIKRIVEACVQLQLTAIVEYPGGLPFVPAKANLIKCEKNTQSGEWEFKLVNRGECNLNKFIKGLETDLKEY